MEDSKYKEFLEQRHPELLKEAEDFFDVSDRGTWDYVCKLLPKLADLPHEKIAPDTMNRDFGWYVSYHFNINIANNSIIVQNKYYK